MSEYVYKPEECTEVIEFDCPNDILIKLALMAHDRDITLNQLLNEIIHEEASRVLAESTKEQPEKA